MEKGRIVKLISNRYSVLLDSGETVICSARGKLRLGASPLCGDIVQVSESEGQHSIEKIEERSNFLKRPPVANIDQALIVMSAAEPEFSSFLVDQLIMLIVHAGIRPVLLITKMDLAEKNPKIFEEIEDYRNSGYTVLLSSKENEKEALSAIAEVLKDKITVLCGQSGVGKSSLLNQIEPTFELHTQEISKALNRGKHTTRHVELHKVAQGYVADTPGFSKLDFSHIDKRDLAFCIPDFDGYVGKCRFNDCMHDKEPGCAVKEAVENKTVSVIRYRHYLSVLNTLMEEEKK